MSTKSAAISDADEADNAPRNTSARARPKTKVASKAQAPLESAEEPDVPTDTAAGEASDETGPDQTADERDQAVDEEFVATPAAPATKPSDVAEARRSDAPQHLESASPAKPRPAKRWMKRLTRLGLVVILAAGAGGGLYYGWPIVRDRYITPVETTATDVATVKERIDRTDAQISDLTETVAGIDASLELLAATDSRQDQSLAQIGARLDSLEDSIGTQTARISALESVSAALQADVAAAADSSTEQVQELLAAEYLSRARLFLYQANYGLAAQDVGAAITLLSPLEPNATRESVVERLGSVVSELPDRPVLAADDLDIAWYTLLGGLTPQPEPIAD